MKVIFIYRHHRQGSYSIEELFHVVASELSKKVDVVEYRVGRRALMLKDAWRLRKINADIYHVTGDVNYMVYFLPKRRTVLTVHDIGHFLYTLRGLKRWLYKWIWLVWPMRMARAVTTVSKATEKNLTAHFGHITNQIVTIENCYSQLYRYVRRPFNRKCPVILQVGTKSYKNVPRLISALCGIPCKLILVGKLDDCLRQQLAECGIDYKNRIHLSREQIVQAYIDSDIIAFVSIGEGFGVPIIEAQASGRPLITANIPPMSEVAGEGACQVSPLEVSEIRDGILKIINDDAYRHRIIDAGLRNAERYSPKKISKRYLMLYQGIISS